VQAVLRLRDGRSRIGLYAAPVRERSDADDDGGVDEIDVRARPAAPARTGDELEDALTDELGRITGQVPAVDLATVPPAAG
jgi:hypothetical protein